MAVLFVGFDANPALAMFGSLRSRLGDTRPAMAAVGEVVVTQVHDSFERGQAPDGAPWKPLKSRQGQIALLSPSVRLAKAARLTAGALVDSGRMLASVGRAYGEDWVEVGAAAAYAAVHQFGARTGPHTIRPRNKRALFWPGARHPVFAVRHPGSVIPARPFIPDEQSLDWPEAVATPSVGLAGDGSPDGCRALLSPSVRLAQGGSPTAGASLHPAEVQRPNPKKTVRFF